MLCENFDTRPSFLGPQRTAQHSHNLGLSFGSGENICWVVAEKNTRPQNLPTLQLLDRTYHWDFVAV